MRIAAQASPLLCMMPEREVCCRPFRPAYHHHALVRLLRMRQASANGV